MNAWNLNSTPSSSQYCSSKKYLEVIMQSKKDIWLYPRREICESNVKFLYLMSHGDAGLLKRVGMKEKAWFWKEHKSKSDDSAKWLMLLEKLAFDTPPISEGTLGEFSQVSVGDSLSWVQCSPTHPVRTGECMERVVWWVWSSRYCWALVVNGKPALNNPLLGLGSKSVCICNLEGADEYSDYCVIKNACHPILC